MRSRAILDIKQMGIWRKRGLPLVALLAIAGGGPAVAQERPPRELPQSVRVKDRALGRASAAAVPDSAPPVGPRIEVSAQEIRTELPALPGAKLKLEVGRGATDGSRFHWTQVEGPPLDLGDPTQSTITVTIPDGAERLGFVMVAARADVVRVFRVVVPLPGDASRISWGNQPTGKVKADAGDDQVGLVGRRVTLNGSRSLPGDGKNARWLQLAGPVVTAPQQQGLFFTFMPSSEGLYRFLLMVAANGELSEPDEVTVLVGAPPKSAGLTAQSAPSDRPAPSPQPITPEQIVSTAMPRLSAGNRLVSDVADVMDGIAFRSSLYESFGSLQSELARRLDVVLPSEPSARAAWADTVFAPLSAYLTGQLLTSGLDVRLAQGPKEPMNAAQKEIVRVQFERLARAFRAVPATR